MGRRNIYRIMPALVGAFGAAAAAYALGAPWLALLPSLLAGGLAAWLLTDDRTPHISTAANVDGPSESSRDLLGKIMQAFNDPLLLVERQQVAIANDAALALLGAHIVGEDVRLAIRHPAAAEKLTGRKANRSDPAIQLVGIGEADRHWEIGRAHV